MYSDHSEDLTKLHSGCGAGIQSGRFVAFIKYIICNKTSIIIFLAFDPQCIPLIICHVSMMQKSIQFSPNTTLSTIASVTCFGIQIDFRIPSFTVCKQFLNQATYLPCLEVQSISVEIYTQGYVKNVLQENTVHNIKEHREL